MVTSINCIVTMVSITARRRTRDTPSPFRLLIRGYSALRSAADGGRCRRLVRPGPGPPPTSGRHAMGEFVSRARDGGATILSEPEDQPHGDLHYRAADL